MNADPSGSQSDQTTVEAPPVASARTEGGWRSRRYFYILLCVTVSAVSLWLAARGVWNDPELKVKFESAVSRADYRTLPPIVAALALFYWL